MTPWPALPFPAALPAPPGNLQLLVLAPHPDDFDAVAVTLKRFHCAGCRIELAVATSGASGVEDSFVRPEDKGAVREAEQLASCRLFGLPEDRVQFLRLREEEGAAADCPENRRTVQELFSRTRPDLVFTPHGCDSNPDHRLIARWTAELAAEAGAGVFFNRDPKTLAMRDDLYAFFGEDEASWKGALLRRHLSQHRRNLNARGCGFDLRILAADRENAARAPFPAPAGYAEVFEVLQPTNPPLLR